MDEERDLAPTQPKIHKLAGLFEEAIGIRSLALTGLFLIALGYTLYLARDFFLPLVVAYVLSSLLAPAVRFLKRCGIPESVSALFIIAAFVGASVYSAFLLAEPARHWIEKAPQSLENARSKLRAFSGSVERAQETGKKIEEITSLGKEQNVSVVELKKPGIGEFVLSGTQQFLLLSGVSVVLLYFLLAAGDLFLAKLVKVLPTLEDKKRAVEICRMIERDVSKYLWTVTVINIGLGAAIGLAMYTLDMPNSLLWGVLAACLNYVPYIGAMVGIISVGLAAALTFDQTTAIISPPVAYFCLTAIEGNFITPLALGRSLSLNPVVIFIWLLFWGWMWGVTGALLAVPLLAIVKIICDRFDSLSAVGEFLGAESRAE